MAFFPFHGIRPNLDSSLNSLSTFLVGRFSAHQCSSIPYWRELRPVSPFVEIGLFLIRHRIRWPLSASCLMRPSPARRRVACQLAAGRVVGEIILHAVGGCSCLGGNRETRFLRMGHLVESQWRGPAEDPPVARARGRLTSPGP